MAALQQIGNFGSDELHVFGLVSLGVKSLDEFGAGVIADQRKWHDDGLAGNFGFAEGGNAFFEDADNGESEFANVNFLAHSVFGRIGGGSEFLSEQANLAAGLEVILIEVSAAKDEKIANGLKAVGDADEADGVNCAVDGHGERNFAGAGGFDDVGRGFWRFNFGVDEVCTNGFDLGNDVALTREGNGDDENDAGAADDHAKHG